MAKKSKKTNGQTSTRTPSSSYEFRVLSADEAQAKRASKGRALFDWDGLVDALKKAKKGQGVHFPGIRSGNPINKAMNQRGIKVSISRSKDGDGFIVFNRE